MLATVDDCLKQRPVLRGDGGDMSPKYLDKGGQKLFFPLKFMAIKDIVLEFVQDEYLLYVNLGLFLLNLLNLCIGYKTLI